MNAEQLLDLIKPRRHLNEPNSISHALKRYKKINSQNEDVTDNDEVIEPIGPSENDNLKNLINDELKSSKKIESDNDAEIFFKVLGQEEVKPICEPKLNYFL